MKITIGHLYPDLLNLYGDRGNIQCLMKRCLWRGIEAETIAYELDDRIDFSKLDIVLLGGGSDREQMLVCEKLKEIQKDFKAYVEDNGVVIAICGGYQLIGNYYKTDQGMIEGLKLVDMSTEQGKGRLIGNIVMQMLQRRLQDSSDMTKSRQHFQPEKLQQENFRLNSALKMWQEISQNTAASQRE